MPITKVEAMQYVCDACKKTETISGPGAGKDASPDGWFKGRAEHGFRAADWVACRKTCINRAVTVALESEGSVD